MEKIFIWGTGDISEQVLAMCDVFGCYEVLGFIDNNPDKEGALFHGREIYPPCILRKMAPDKIVVLTNFYSEIKEQIMREFSEFLGIVENKNFFYKQMLIRRHGGSTDPEIVQILDYLKDNDLQVFNYDFVKKYEGMNIDVQFDVNCGLYFVWHENKKLYFAKSLNTHEKVEKYYKGILIEQDAKSPHKYLDDAFDVKEGDVVVDIGVAEGNFSLQVADKASKIYMIETDEDWIDALTETFKNYKDKIVIIKKFATSIDMGKYAALDSLIDEPVDFIKMDIEGNEWDALLGAKKIIGRSKNVKCAICCYHSDFDEDLIRDALTGYGLSCSSTSGYMWYPAMLRQTYVSTRLCRGIIRGVWIKEDA